MRSTSSGIDRYSSAAGVTPPGDQMFHGTHLAWSEPLSTDTQTGAPPAGLGTTLSESVMLALEM